MREKKEKRLVKGLLKHVCVCVPIKSLNTVIRRGVLNSQGEKDGGKDPVKRASVAEWKSPN